MFEIYIDTTDRHISIIELRKDNQVKSRTEGAIDVVTAIAEVLKSNNLVISDIGKFSMNPGPGSFTGLKISSAIVNALNWAVTGRSSKDLILPNYQASAVDKFSS